MKTVKAIIFSIFLQISQNVFSLEIGEKLSVEFLKLSDSKKTVLINRGAEDGIISGDHAKFYISNGIIARGVAEKVSPSRSIWSFYRIFAENEMIENKKLSMKISSPVKITIDSTKSLKDEKTITGDDQIIIPIESKMKNKIAQEDSQDEERELSELSEKSDLKIKSSKNSNNSADIFDTHSTTLSNKNWEAFGTLSLNSLSGTIAGSSGTSSTSSSVSALDLSIGIERYFYTSETLKNISIFGLLYKKSMEEGDRAKTTTDWFQYGAGLNYHFYNSPQMINRLIGFGTMNAGLGTSTIKTKISTGSTAEEDSVTGTNNFFSFGIGAKFSMEEFGARGVFDYNIINETFTYITGATSTRSLSGPRIQLGLSYRF